MQPTRMEKVAAIVKSLILRALVIYFVMSFIRGNTSKSPSVGKDSTGKPIPIPVSTNVYPNGTEFVGFVD